MELAGIMTPNPKTVKPETPIVEAARLLATNRIHCLPVLDERRALVGIVPPSDIMRAFIGVCTSDAA